MDTDVRSTRTVMRFKEEVYAIIGAAIEVHSILGSGFLEAVYQEALAFEMTARAIPFQPQPRLQVEYKGKSLRACYIPDFICFEVIIIEIKALDRLTTKEVAQLLNTMKAASSPIGLLINFGSVGKLEWQRLIH